MATGTFAETGALGWQDIVFPTLANLRAGRTYLARESASAQALRPKDCDVRHQSEDEILAAKYRNAPAALVYQRPQGSSQVVYLFVCGSSEPIKTTTLPAP